MEIRSILVILPTLSYISQIFYFLSNLNNHLKYLGRIDNVFHTDDSDKDISIKCNRKYIGN